MDLALPPMPFSAVAAPTGAAYLIVPAEMRNSASSTEIELPPGVVQVIVTWQGAEPLSVRHHRGDQMEVVHVIPSAASGVQRSTGVLTLASDDTHQIRITHYSGRGDLWQQETLDRGYVAGIQVMPMGTAADITGGGSLLRVDNSVGTRVFLGNQMIYGDTGWRNINKSSGMFSEYVDTVFGGTRLRRIGDRCEITFDVRVRLNEGPITLPAPLVTFPVGFRPYPGYMPNPLYGFGSHHAYINTDHAFELRGPLLGAGNVLGGRWSWTVRAGEPWPTSLPGTVA